MKTNDKGIELTKEREGKRLKIYLDTGDVPTIGYGHVLLPGEDKEFRDGITDSKAEELLRQDIKVAERGVTNLVKVPLTENQFSALVSLVFNIGVGNFRRSTLLQRLNALDYPGVAREWKRWVYDNKKKLTWLEKFREKELELFQTND